MIQTINNENMLGTSKERVELLKAGIDIKINCWEISGTGNGTDVNGTFAKKILSCKSCGFFKTVKEQEGVHFHSANPKASQVNNHLAMVVG